MRLFFMALAAAAFSATAAAAEFSISFEWGNIPDCRTGKAKTVNSPRFVVKGVPAGTTQIQFRMKDQDAPQYNHGGGKVKISSDGVIPFGTFKYKGPCPPRGTHTYVWTAIAKKGGKKLATARAKRDYPE